MAGKKEYTANDLAKKIGVSKRRIIQMIEEGKISAEKKFSVFGFYWSIPSDEAERVIRSKNK